MTTGEGIVLGGRGYLVVVGDFDRYRGGMIGVVIKRVGVRRWRQNEGLLFRAAL